MYASQLKDVVSVFDLQRFLALMRYFTL